MKATSSDRARRALAEFAVIVVGVLVALWIDAGWSWLQDRREERALLLDLRADFRANLAMARDIELLRDQGADLGERLIVEGVDALPEDSLDIVLSAVRQIETMNPRTGALESALSAGRIDLLRSDELRSALASWPGHLSDAEEETQWLIQPSLRLYFETQADRMRGVGSREILRRMMDDPDLTGIVAGKTAAYRSTGDEIDALVSVTQRIVSLLDAELGGGS
jgi:hypothetical protein